MWCNIPVQSRIWWENFKKQTLGVFIKKRLQHRTFPKYRKIFKNTYFETHLWTNASEVSAENIYNAQQTFKELFRKLAEVKTNCSSDLMCFGLWQLKIPFSAGCTNFSTLYYLRVLMFTIFQMLKPTLFHSITNQRRKRIFEKIVY